MERATDGRAVGGGTRRERAAASGKRRGGGRDAAGWEGEGGPSPGGSGQGSCRSLSTREGDEIAARAPCR